MTIPELLTHVDNVATLYVYINSNYYNEDKSRPLNKMSPDFMLSNIGHWPLARYIQRHLLISQIEQFFISEQNTLLVLLKVDENTCNAGIF